MSPVKQLTLKQFLANRPADVVFLQETFLKPHHKISIPNYRCYRCDRIGGRGGGVAILIHRSVPHKQISLIEVPHIEFVSVGIEVPSQPTLVLSSVYIPPNALCSPNELVQVFCHHPHHLAMGDFNAKDFWSPGPTNANGRALSQFLENNNFHIIHLDGPTFHSSSNGARSNIDFIITKLIVCI